MCIIKLTPKYVVEKIVSHVLEKMFTCTQLVFPVLNMYKKCHVLRKEMKKKAYEN